MAELAYPCAVGLPTILGLHLGVAPSAPVAMPSVMSAPAPAPSAPQAVPPADTVVVPMLSATERQLKHDVAAMRFGADHGASTPLSLMEVEELVAGIELVCSRRVPSPPPNPSEPAPMPAATAAATLAGNAAAATVPPLAAQAAATLAATPPLAAQVATTAPLAAEAALQGTVVPPWRHKRPLTPPRVVEKRHCTESVGGSCGSDGSHCAESVGGSCGSGGTYDAGGSWGSAGSWWGYDASSWLDSSWHGGSEHEGDWRRGSGYFRRRPCHKDGPRWGERGGNSNPNVQWHSLKAKARREGWMNYFRENYPKPTRKFDS